MAEGSRSETNVVWAGAPEGSVHGSLNFLCPRFFLLFNMNDVDAFKKKECNLKITQSGGGGGGVK